MFDTFPTTLDTDEEASDWQLQEERSALAAAWRLDGALFEAVVA
jgi:hypothetical protein